jgi:hypothetical protein
MFYHFWDFDRMFEDGVPGKAEIMGSQTLFRALLALGFM